MKDRNAKKIPSSFYCFFVFLTPSYFFFLFKNSLHNYTNFTNIITGVTINNQWNLHSCVIVWNVDNYVESGFAERRRGIAFFLQQSYYRFRVVGNGGVVRGVA